MSNSTILRGHFVSAGQDVFIPLRSGYSAVKTRNWSIYSAQTAANGINYYWQLGMAQNDAMIELFNGAGTAITADTAANLGVGGFTFTDTSIQTVGVPIVFTQVTNAAPPLVLTANTAGLIANQTVVRLYFQNGVAPYAQQLAGIDFTVGAVVNNVSFSLLNMPVIVATGAPVAGTYSIISGAGVPYWYPSRRVISNITNAAQAVVSTTVDHAYQVGQQVRFSNVNQVRPGSLAYGMFQINNLTGNIVATTAGTFTVDIDTTGFGAFAFPVTANYPFTPAVVVPVGEDTATALAQPAPGVNILSGATINTAEIGVILAAGITSPAGSNGDIIYWEASTDFNL